MGSRRSISRDSPTPIQGSFAFPWPRGGFLLAKEPSETAARHRGKDGEDKKEKNQQNTPKAPPLPPPRAHLGQKPPAPLPSSFFPGFFFPIFAQLRERGDRGWGDKGDRGDRAPLAGVTSEIFLPAPEECASFSNQECEQSF